VFSVKMAGTVGLQELVKLSWLPAGASMQSGALWCGEFILGGTGFKCIASAIPGAGIK
jgi:hypothetical protein